MKSRILASVTALSLLAACSPSGPNAALTHPPPTAVIYDVRLPTSLPSTQTSGQALLPPETLSTEQLHARLDPFSGMTPDCSLPCYNGFTPGQAELIDAYNFYSRLGIGIADLVPGDYQAIQDGEGQLRAWLTKTTDADRAAEMGLAAPLASISVADNTPQSLYIGWGYEPPYLTLPIILQQLGAPERLDLALDFSQEPPTYLLQLVYADLSTGFAFAGATGGDSATRQVCLSGDPVQAVSMGLFAPGHPPMDGIPNSALLLPLSDTLGLSYEEFATRVTAGNCIDVPASAWPAWQSLQTTP
jgi:hypothetical protein